MMLEHATTNRIDITIGSASNSNHRSKVHHVCSIYIPILIPSILTLSTFTISLLIFALTTLIHPYAFSLSLAISLQFGIKIKIEQSAEELWCNTGCKQIRNKTRVSRVDWLSPAD